MSKPITIAVQGMPLGVVVPHQGGFRFMAVKLDVWPLEGRVFASVEDASKAAAALLTRAGLGKIKVEGLLVA